MNNNTIDLQTKRKHHSKLAVASFVFAILSYLILACLVLVGSRFLFPTIKKVEVLEMLPLFCVAVVAAVGFLLVAFSLGIAGFLDIANNKDSLKGKVFALLGVFGGAVPVIVIFYSLTFFSFKMATYQQKQAKVVTALQPGGTSPAGDIKKIIRYWEEGVSALRNRRYEQTIESCNKFLEAAEKLKANAYYLIGASYQQMGRYEEAIKELDQAIALQPDLYDAHQDRAVTFRLMGKYQDSVDSCKEIIRIFPSAAKTYCSMGWAYEKMGRFKQAVECHLKAIGLAPSWAFPRQRLKYCLSQINDEPYVRQVLEKIEKN